MNGSFNDTINSTLTTTDARISNFGEPAMRVVFIIIAVIYMFVGIVAIPGNLLILWITMMNKHLRTPINLLVCNLAIAGLLIVWIRIPIKIYELLYPIQALFFYPFNISVCKMLQIIPGGCITSISITLTTICIDRYNSIVYPTKYKRRMNLIKVYIFLPLCWLFAFSFWTPYANYMKIITIGNQRFNVCVPDWPLNPDLDLNITNSGHPYIYIPVSKLYLWLSFTILIFLIPTGIMTTLYIIAAKKLWRSGPISKYAPTSTSTRFTNERGDRSTRYSSGLRIKKRVIKIFIACLALFIASNLPYYLIFMLIEFQLILGFNYYLVNSIINILILLNYTSVAYNAIIYGYFNYTFRSNAPRWLRYISSVCSLIRKKQSS
ncbi:Substance-K receptor [Trichoplax sp. H2]|nr:Substance-K receptor [Trichoplax sp. H2]|eukprot:RDD44232.1 Substance-K receptor [Trichoplax sp. H2]